MERYDGRLSSYLTFLQLHTVLYCRHVGCLGAKNCKMRGKKWPWLDVLPQNLNECSIKTRKLVKTYGFRVVIKIRDLSNTKRITNNYSASRYLCGGTEEAHENAPKG